MLNPNPSPHSDPEVLTRFQEELARAAAMPGLAPPGPALWPRFAGYYQELARLPRKARRALQRRWRRSLGGLALLLALGQAPALAATIAVDGTSCTLVDAVTAANNDAPTGGCTAGIGADTLVLPAGSIHTLTAVDYNSYNAGLPPVASAITIAGNGSTITRDPSAPPFHILEVSANGVLTLQETTVSGGTAGFGGGGVSNYGTLTLTNSTVSGNSASYGGGVSNYGTLTLTNSTVSGNSSSGVSNSFFGTLTLTNSTVSGNSGATRGGGVNNFGTLTLTNSTVSGNTARNVGGGLFNYGQTTLAFSLVSGNTAIRGAEIFVDPLGGAVTANNFNLFGHSGLSDYQAFFLTFAPGPSDLSATAVGTRPTALGAILSPSLAANGGPTRTRALVAGSPAVDAAPAGNCATTTDQRGAPRPQDGDGNTVADCDIGAFELGTQPPVAVAANQNPQASCTESRCSIPIRCNLDPASGAQCTVQIDFFVSRSAARLSEPASTKGPGRIRFAAGITNIPPGATANVRLRPTRQGRRIVRTSTRRSLRGVMEIRNSAGTVTSTRIRIRLR